MLLLTERDLQRGRTGAVRPFGSRTEARLLAALATAAGLAVALPAAAQTGVSDDRVSLPEGPGSLEGIGENVSVDGNMGLLSHRIAIEVPDGFAGVTPDVSLSYSSGNGNGVIGMGWSLTFPAIERLTLRGLPEYDADDEFAVNGSEQLVRIAGTSPPVYRSRFENGFVRYTWHEAGDGTGGYWTGEYPDGRIGYFGADAQGNLVAASRVTGPDGVFRYHLTEMVDRYGHRMRYTYQLFGSVTLPLHIGYVFRAGDTARYEVTFQYEDRTDKQSDCRPGFEELLEVRLSAINVFSAGSRIRRYALTYEPMEVSGGQSRIARVETIGMDDGLYPIVHRFGYSQALGAACPDSGCSKPYVVEMPTPLGVNLLGGNTTLIDINGDGLADILDTSEPGAHRFFINTLKAGSPHDFAPATPSAVGTQSSHDLSSMAVQVLDVNGDGFTDILNAQQGVALMNRGTGDWDATPLTLWGQGADGGLPGDFVPSDGELKTVRFLDYDNDKRIDVIKSTGTDAANVTLVYRNTGTGAFQLAAGVEPIGAPFDSGTLELNDMNGDGLLDPVQVQATLVRYRLNLGRGKWGPWREIGGFNFTDQEQVEAELEDLNGDALADLVIVSGNEVRYWLNRNGASFDPPVVLTSADVAGGLPTKEDRTVLFADINGNGSSDVVWIDANGKVIYLELVPVRPNLLTRIENGLGRQTDVTYASSAAQQALDGGPGAWEHALPNPLTVVTEVDETDALTEVHLRTRYTYRDGYYDPDEKDFRGYARVETEIYGDDLQRPGRKVESYELGVADDYRQGLLLSQEVYSDGALMSRLESTYADCEVAGVPDSGLLFDVRHICKTLEVTRHVEGRPESEVVTTEVATRYDGYGQVTLQEERGVTSVGGAGCPACQDTGYTGTPCGPQCLGDERYSATEYGTPEDNGGLWILDRPIRERTYGEADPDGQPATEWYAETVTYYDGPAFEGLPFGKLSHGTPTRMVKRVDASGATIDLMRVKLDAHGNTVEEIGPNGTLADAANARLRWVFDEEGLHRLASERLVTGPTGPRVLRRDYAWHPQWGKVVQATEEYLLGSAATPGQTTFTYDQFGRLTSRSNPGGLPGAPSEKYTYELGSPASRLLFERRTAVDGPLDLISVQCLDGHGREYQTRKRVADGQWLVSGFTTFGAFGKTRESFLPYYDTSGDCGSVPAVDAPRNTIAMDALGRPIRAVGPSVGGEDEPMVQEWVFGPLSRTVYDAEDTRTGGPHAETPTVERHNGLGRLIAVERRLTPGGPAQVHTLAYDPLGNLTAITDPTGLTRVKVHDLLGRVVTITDPDSGTTHLTYDAAGNIVRREDSAGRVAEMVYDGLDREIERSNPSDPDGTRVTQRYDVAPEGCSGCTHPVGRLAEVVYPVGDGTWATDRAGYDLQGEVVWTSRALHGRTFEMGATLDHARRVTARTWPTGDTVTYTLDGLGRIVGVPGYVTSATYDATGQVTTAALANGTTRSVTYDDLGQVLAVTAAGPGGQALLAYTLQWDRAGNLVQVADDRADDGQPMGGGSFQYDALYRLVAAHLDPDRPAHAETLTYTWDAAERLTGKTSSLGGASPAHVGTLGYGAGDGLPRAVTSAGGVTYTYDATGRMVGRGELTFERDEDGMVARVLRGGQEIAAMGYDYAGARVYHRQGDTVTWTLASDLEVRDHSAVLSISLGGQRVVRVERPAFAAQILSDLAPAQGPDSGLVPAPDAMITAGDAWIAQAVDAGALSLAAPAPLSDVTALLDATTRRLLHGLDPVVRYEHRDHLGSVAAVTDESGALVSRTQYYPMGGLRYGAGPEAERGYTGKERDESGLIYFGVRFLDPGIGRWDAPDPHFEMTDPVDPGRVAESQCNYTFVMGRPLSRLDNDGRFLVIGLVAAVVGGAVIAAGLYHFHKETERAMEESFGTKAKERAREEGYAERTAEFAVQMEDHFNRVPRVIKKGAVKPMKESKVTVSVIAEEDVLSDFQSWAVDRMIDGGIVGGTVGLFASDKMLRTMLDRKHMRLAARKESSVKRKQKQIRQAAKRMGRPTPGGPTPGGPTPGGPSRKSGGKPDSGR